MLKTFWGTKNKEAFDVTLGNDRKNNVAQNLVWCMQMKNYLTIDQVAAFCDGKEKRDALMS